MAKLRETEEQVAGLRTRVLELDGQGPPFLLVHGFTDSADTWRALLREFAISGRAAIAFDLPGFGAAEPMPAGDVMPRFEAAVADLSARLTARYEQPPVIVGNSLGALVVMWTANRRRARVSGMVSVCPGGLCHPLWLPILATPPATKFVRWVVATPARIPALGFVLERILATNRTPDVIAHLPRYLSHLNTRRLAHQLTIFRRFLDEDDYPIDLSKITCPAMFVFGTRDRVLINDANRARVQRIARRIDHADHHELAGIGHVPQLEAPTKLRELLEQFNPASAPTLPGHMPPDCSPSNS
jgi:pimeloyl-ACP methyl ester carboxylesterase